MVVGGLRVVLPALVLGFILGWHLAHAGGQLGDAVLVQGNDLKSDERGILTGIRIGLDRDGVTDLGQAAQIKGYEAARVS